MATENPRIHIICGICGSNSQFEFKIDMKGKEDKQGNLCPAVFIICKNCSSLTGLDEIIKDELTTNK